MRRRSKLQLAWWWLRRAPKEAWYWLRCHTYNRYHIVDCRNRFYKWGYSDVDFLMINACFELLRRFIEREDGLAQLEFQGQAFRDDAKAEWHNEENKAWCLAEGDRRDATYNEVLYLWHWWTVERSPDSGLRDDEYEKDTEMLTRLIKVRGSLWT